MDGLPCFSLPEGDLHCAYYINTSNAVTSVARYFSSCLCLVLFFAVLFLPCLFSDFAGLLFFCFARFLFLFSPGMAAARSAKEGRPVKVAEIAAEFGC